MKKDRLYPAVMTALVLVIVAIFGWILYREWQDRRADGARQTEGRQWKERAEDLAQRISRLEQELQAARGETAGEDRFVKIIEPPAPAAPGKDQPAGVDAQVLAFFRYLDGRDYVKARGLEGGTYALFTQGVAELAANPPRVAGETDSLFTVIRNVSHFFRVLGKQRVELAAEVLNREADLMEPAMRLFYQWATAAGASTLKGRPGEETLYQYASFFTETLGGRSYVMRRGGKLRLLTLYYCILVLDRANDRQSNPNGVDIRPLIAATAAEMRAQAGLAYRPQYLAELERLARKYDVPRGG